LPTDGGDAAAAPGTTQRHHVAAASALLTFPVLSLASKGGGTVDDPSDGPGQAVLLPLLLKGEEELRGVDPTVEDFAFSLLFTISDALSAALSGGILALVARNFLSFSSRVFIAVVSPSPRCLFSESHLDR
jgi:hypothetical protein